MKGDFLYMKSKIFLLLAASLMVVSCNKATPSSEAPKSSINDSSVVPAASVSSDRGTSSEQKSSSVAPSSAKGSSSAKPSSSSAQPSSSAQQSSSSSASSSTQPLDEAYHAKVRSILLTDEESNPIDLEFDVPREYLSFAHKSTTFNKNLAIEALSFVAAAPYKEELARLYTYHSFDDIYYSEDYDKEQEKDSVLFSLAHKKIGSDDLVVLSLSGYDYQKQWEQNLTIGKEGHHAGFAEGVTKVLPKFLEYLAKYNKPKVFVNGYSRTAAIANLMSTYILDDKVVEESNYYAYLFETPKGVSVENTKEYKSVFNIVNSADLVTYVAPTEYGLKRVGVDIELYSENADAKVKEYNEKLVLPAFTPRNEDPEDESIPNFANDVDFVNFVISYLLKPITDIGDGQKNRDISTRANFVDNIQGDAAYLVSLFFSLPSDVVEDIKTKLSEMGAFGMLGLLSTDGLYNFLTPILNEHNFAYDDAQLKASTNAAVELATQKIALLLLFASEDYKPNLMRLIYFHALETVIPLVFALNTAE